MNNILNTLITDRTWEDVELARELNAKDYEDMLPTEKAAWDAGLKGAYCYIDMNRVVDALEYLNDLINAAGREGCYTPVTVRHKVPKVFSENGEATAWDEWTDTVWIEYDFLRRSQWSAHLGNIRAFWARTRCISARVLPVYDPHDSGTIKPEETFTAGDVCRIDKCCGLMELRVEVSCAPGTVELSGQGWTVDGTSAVLAYPGGPYPDVDEALAALAFRCTVPEGITDASVSLFATLRHDVERPLGTCTVQWSPFIRWGGARNLWGSWGGAKPLTWGQASRGGGDSG